MTFREREKAKGKNWHYFIIKEYEIEKVDDTRRLVIKKIKEQGDKCFYVGMVNHGFIYLLIFRSPKK